MEPKKEFLAWLEEAHPEIELGHAQRQFLEAGFNKERILMGGRRQRPVSAVWLALAEWTKDRLGIRSPSQEMLKLARQEFLGGSKATSVYFDEASEIPLPEWTGPDKPGDEGREPITSQPWFATGKTLAIADVVWVKHVGLCSHQPILGKCTEGTTFRMMDVQENILFVEPCEMYLATREERDDYWRGLDKPGEEA